MKIVKNIHGFSITTVLMAAGLLGFLATVLVQMSETTSTTQKRSLLNTDRNSFINELRSLLTDQNICTNSLRFDPSISTTFTKMKKADGSDSDIYVADLAYGISRLEVENFVFSGPPEDGFHLLTINFRSKRKIQIRRGEIKIKVTSLTGGGLVNACFSAAGGDDGLWTRAANDLDIFYADGLVGIGTPTPNATLHVRSIDGSDGLIKVESSAMPGKTLSLASNNGDGLSSIQSFDDATGTPLPLVLNASGGSVGVGTTSPTSLLHAFGTISSSRTDSPAGNLTSIFTVPGQNIGVLNYGGTAPINDTLQLRLENAPMVTIKSIAPIGVTAVGIGTTNPEENLHVDGIFKIARPSNTGAIRIFPSEPDIAYQATGTGGHIFQTNGNSTKVKITNSGNVGIGTLIPSTKLEVIGTARVTALVETSDERLKENIRPSKGLEIIRQIKGVHFNWKESVHSMNQRKSYGVIAQNIEKVLPELVMINKNNGEKSVHYHGLV
jgi:hypothetical protein